MDAVIFIAVVLVLAVAALTPREDKPSRFW